MRTLPRRRLACALALLPLWATACGEASDAGRGSDERPIVAVSVLPQAWLVERLAGDVVAVVALIPPGANEASWEPGLAERRTLERAALYVKVGHPHFPFEANWLGPLLGERDDLPIVDCASGLDSFEHDPHLWLSPANMGAIAGPLADALVAVAPASEAAIRANAASLHDELDALDAQLREILAGSRGKSFVVVHPAWGYFADDYDLVQIAILEENREPDPRRLAQLIARVRALGVTVVFSQPQFDAASARVVAAEIGARVESLDPLAADWATNLIHVARRLAAEARG